MLEFLQIHIFFLSRTLFMSPTNSTNNSQRDNTTCASYIHKIEIKSLRWEIFLSTSLASRIHYTAMDIEKRQSHSPIFVGICGLGSRPKKTRKHSPHKNLITTKDSYSILIKKWIIWMDIWILDTSAIWNTLSVWNLDCWLLSCGWSVLVSMALFITRIQVTTALGRKRRIKANVWDEI